ncbi:CdaR family protein [Paenibacillus taiwanensis]|uniref:CdaR family protein n=1 Tax=Paenibacillus taiwanensis TaxID=401638 RepID=UPI0004019FF7|nr:CdaR family protein [Paenibacillus taiwanensis]
MDKWLMNNTAAKIIALVLGVLLFAVVHKEDPNTVTQQSLFETRWIDSVKINTIGLDEQQLAMRSMSPSDVRIQVSGKRTTITSALPEDYKVVLDLTGYGPGKHSIPLKYEVPLGVDMRSMQPSSVTVVLEEVQTKQYEVLIKTEGRPADGYKAGTPIVRPSNRVHVTLPTSRMQEIRSVSAIVDISKANESVLHKQVKLTAFDAAGREVKNAIITPSVVEVEIPITKPFKTVPLQLNVRGNLPAGLSVAALEPNVNQVTLYGPQAALDSIEFYDVPQLDVSTFSAPGTYNVNVKLTSPPNIEKMEPSTILVKVTIAQDKKRVIEGVPITLTGVNDKLITNITEPASRKFNVTVVGSPSVVDALTVDDIQLIANINDLPPGKHAVTLQVNLPRFVRLADGERYTATIEIKDKDVPATTDPVTPPNPTTDGQQPEGERPATGGNVRDTDSHENEHSGGQDHPES